MWYVMYFRFCGEDDVTFSDNRVNDQNQRWQIIFVELARWQQRGRSLPSPIASCFVVRWRHATYSIPLARVFTTGPPNKPVLFCSLASVGVCRLSLSVTLPAGERADRPPGMRPTLHGGPVVLRPAKARRHFVISVAHSSNVGSVAAKMDDDFETPPPQTKLLPRDPKNLNPTLGGVTVTRLKMLDIKRRTWNCKIRKWRTSKVTIDTNAEKATLL